MINPNDVENLTNEELEKLLGKELVDQITNNKGDDENGSDTKVQ